MDAFLLGTIEQIVDGWIKISVPFWGVAIGDLIAVGLEDKYHAVTGLKIRDKEVDKITSAFVPFHLKADTLNHAQIKNGDQLFLKKQLPASQPPRK